MRKGQKKEAEPRSRHDILYSSSGAFDSFQKKCNRRSNFNVPPSPFSTNALIPSSEPGSRQTGFAGLDPEYISISIQ